MQKRRLKRYLQMLTVRLDLNGPDEAMKMTAAFLLPTASGPVAPWSENAIPRFWARFRERKTRGGRTKHDEPTSDEIGAEDRLLTTRGSIRRRLGLRSGCGCFGTSVTADTEQDGAEGGTGSAYIAPVVRQDQKVKIGGGFWSAASKESAVPMA
jgi:hypothetical protein